MNAPLVRGRGSSIRDIASKVDCDDQQAISNGGHGRNGVQGQRIQHKAEDPTGYLPPLCLSIVQSLCNLSHTPCE